MNKLQRLSALANWLQDVLAEARAAKTPEAKEAALLRAKWLFPAEPADFSNCRPDWAQPAPCRISEKSSSSGGPRTDE